MQAILSYIITVINGIVDLLSVQLFDDFPLTVFQFMCSIVVIMYLFKFIFGGTKEFDNFANLSIRDVSRSMNNSTRKTQIVSFSNSKKDVSKNTITTNNKVVEPVPSWFDNYNDIEVVRASKEDIAELGRMLREFR